MFKKSKEKRKLQASEEYHLEKMATQVGHVIGIIDKRVLENQESMWNPMSWRSYRVKRKCNSSLAGETQAALNGVGHAIWFKILLRELLTGSAGNPEARLSEESV